MSSSHIKHLLVNPVEFNANDPVSSKGKYYYAEVTGPGHVVMPEGVEPGDSVTISYPVHAIHRIPTPEPKRLPRNQRIPHLKRGGFKRR